MQNLVTIFGGSGFVGSQTVRAFARRGWRVRVAVRQPHLAYEMRLHGDVGQVDIVQANIRNEASIRRALEGASAAVNAVGVLYSSGRQGFGPVHIAGAANVAAAAADMGVSTLVHVSALGADADSPSAYARSKAEGEAAVRAALPSASVVRPSIVFGQQDDFFNRFAAMARMSPALPLIGGGKTRFQPVFVGDVADAIARIVVSGASGGTYELGGPSVQTFRELMERVLAETGRRRLLVPMPYPVAGLVGIGGDLAAWVGLKPPLTSDQVTLLRADNVAGGDHPGLAELGIAPTPLESILPTYLYRYRKGGQFADQDAVATA